MLQPMGHRPPLCACPAHVLGGGFAPDRRRARMQAGDGVAESFGDVTPKTPSSMCSGDRTATAGLYETLTGPRALLFRNARIVAMDGTAAQEGRDVMVRDGRIAWVEPTGGPVPEGAIVIEARGKTLIPGLTEIHAHIFTPTWAEAFAPMIGCSEKGLPYVLPHDLLLFQLLANGITRIEIMAGCPDTLWMRDSVRSGTLVGPRLSVGSPMVDGWPAMHSPTMSYIVGDRAGGERAGETMAEMGFDFAKPYSRLPADGYEGLMATCDRLGIRVMGHVPEAVGIEAAIARGQGGIAHAAELFYNLEGADRDNPERIEQLVRLMADAGTWLQATMVVCERMEWRRGMSGLTCPDRGWMNPVQRALWAEDSSILASIRANRTFDKYYDRTFELTADVVQRARQAGVRILTGTDFPNPYVVEGFSLHEELQLLVDHGGLTPAEALQASTRQAAIYHDDGAADGMVVAGGAADLVLIDGDPLSDISATRKIDTVLVAGTTLIRKAAIEEGLARIQARFVAMPACQAAAMDFGGHEQPAD